MNAKILVALKKPLLVPSREPDWTLVHQNDLSRAVNIRRSFQIRAFVA